jgi:predicted nucleic acid-binding protein
VIHITIIGKKGFDMRIYLDNCCFNRPYDDQSSITISLETQAKLYIQNLIHQGKIEMVTSYMLMYENGQNPYEMRQKAITEFIEKNTTVYVSEAKQEAIVQKAQEIMQTGVKYKDACHVSCAIFAECDYFLTTDNRLLKYKTDEIKMMNPLNFIKELEA